MSKIKKCRICGSKKFKKVIDFGKNPLVNSLIDREDIDKTESVFPLVVEQCQECFLVQIVNPIDSHKIYRDQDYLYFSGDMPGLKDYFREYAEDVKERFLSPGDFVVEIGSNDGTMLKMFSEDYLILGIDPASNCVVRSLRNGVPALSDGFSERIARSVKREFGEASVVYGNNCIAHIDDLHSVIRGVGELLKEDGVFIVECNYWGGMVKNTNYSLIYHDHFSYFSVKNWSDIASVYGMKVFDAVVTPSQGGSLRIFLCNDDRPVTDRCEALFKEEADTNLNSYETCKMYEKQCREEAEKLNLLIWTLKESGKKIAGYGAAAKGFSILKLADIDERHIDYFVDDSPAKQDKYTPVSHIPILSREKAEAVGLPDYFFITAPNYKDIIIEKERKAGFKGKFITDKSEII